MGKRLFALSLLAAGQLLFGMDSDMDGVEDAIDRCPRTPLSDLVDRSGCTTTSLDSKSHFDIIVGGRYSQINSHTFEEGDTTTTTLQADYYEGNVWAQLATSYYRTDSSQGNEQGMDDTTIALYIKSPQHEGLTLQTGIGVILPTYDSGYGNEAADYMGSVSLHYLLSEKVHCMAGYTYTLVNDDDVPGVVAYQNTRAFFAGTGYILDSRSFINASYQETQSIYKGIEPIKTAALTFFYQLTPHWFTIAEYRHGLSDSAGKHEGSVQVGYYF